MKFLTRQSFAITVLLALSTQTVWAHDPTEHAKEEAEKCESMQKMDMSKMDHKDPAMQAMMQKCAKKTSTAHDVMPAMDHSHMQNMKMDDMNNMPMKMDHSNMAMPATTPSSK
ncbi:MAG: hypothetical protein KGO49_08320 [Gammaproteobacteria bacterium]|jgi:hypothetical protein|nr:hypothetical protein [Gammaproteobacteria bacterium]